MSETIPIVDGTNDHRLPLCKEIPKSTTKIHAKVNKLIVARLPLALPSRASDPGAFATGMLHIAPIYATFETLCQEILDQAPTAEERGSPLPHEDKNIDGISSRPKVGKRIHAFLERIFIPGLRRSKPPKADICDMFGWTTEVYDEQLKAVSETGELAHFLAHVRQVIHEKPHVLISYSYLMYMGLFAGGRFIRSSFENAGHQFWSATSTSPVMMTMMRPHGLDNTASPNHSLSASKLTSDDKLQPEQSRGAALPLPLRFLHFDTLADGEDLRREYKEKLSDMEDSLTREEREEVIQEAHAIFQKIALIVGQLDVVMQGSGHQHSIISLFISQLGWIWNTLDHSLRYFVDSKKGDQNSGHNRMSSSATMNGHSGLVLGEDGFGNIDLCPGIPRSMKFSKSLDIPVHEHIITDSGGLGMKPQRIASSVLVWIVFAALSSTYLAYKFSTLFQTRV